MQGELAVSGAVSVDNFPPPPPLKEPLNALILIEFIEDPGSGYEVGQETFEVPMDKQLTVKTVSMRVSADEGAEANFVAQWHLLDSGRPAAVMLPNYMQVPGMVQNFGAPLLPFHLLEETGWQPDLDQLETALS